MKNPTAPAVTREAEEDWRSERASVTPLAICLLDDLGMVQDESGGAARGGVGGASEDSPVASLSRLRPRAAV